MKCSHSTLLAYTLSVPDHQDICKRLADTNISVAGLPEHSNYLTPCSLRYSHRKSVLTTTKTTKSSEGDYLSLHSPAPAGHAHETEADGAQATTFSAHNSGGRSGRNSLLIPQQLFNCAHCGSIILQVSKALLFKPV